MWGFHCHVWFPEGIDDFPFTLGAEASKNCTHAPRCLRLWPLRQEFHQGQHEHMRKVVFESISIIGIGHFSPQFSDKPSFFVSTELENLDSCSPVNLLDFELGKRIWFSSPKYENRVCRRDFTWKHLTSEQNLFVAIWMCLKLGVWRPNVDRKPRGIGSKPTIFHMGGPRVLRSWSLPCLLAAVYWSILIMWAISNDLWIWGLLWTIAIVPYPFLWSLIGLRA